MLLILTILFSCGLNTASKSVTTALTFKKGEELLSDFSQRYFFAES